METIYAKGKPTDEEEKSKPSFGDSDDFSRMGHYLPQNEQGTD